jgi:hypothetical protein
MARYHRLKTRPHPKKKGRVQVKLNGRWRSRRDFTTTCWAWANGKWCDGEVEYWTPEDDNNMILMQCNKCGATQWRWPGYKPPKPAEGGFQHGWLRERRRHVGY